MSVTLRASNLEQAAQLLHERIQQRAANEGVPYDLSPEFFLQALRQGARLFFGVEVQVANDPLEHLH